MTFQTLLIHPAVQSLGWALLHFIWQGVLLATLFFVADRLIRRSQARLRYAIGCMTMLLMPAVFVATIFQSHPFLAPAFSVRDARVVVVPGAETVHLNSTPGPAHVSVPSVLAGGHSLSFEPAVAVPGFVVCLWLAGIVALSIGTAGGWIRVRRLRRRGVEPFAAARIETLEALMLRLQVSRPVRLYTSAIAEVPMVIGLVRPYILLPVSAVTGLSESQLRAVLAHELAHIRRHDYLVNLLQTAVETLLFYHPAVWWLSRRVRQEREHCCDDLAVEVCGDVMEYAGALAQLEELRGCASDLALAATGGDLLARIRRLMGQSGEKGRDRISGPLGVTLAVALLLGAAIGVGHTPAIHAQSSAPRVAQAAPAPLAQIQAASVPAPPTQAKRPLAPTVVAPKAEVAASQEQPAGKLLEFEVASIKPFDPGILRPGTSMISTCQGKRQFSLHSPEGFEAPHG
jgi:beta-lactamase regulating signal transducer with metallopeptidase domain